MTPQDSHGIFAYLETGGEPLEILFWSPGWADEWIRDINPKCEYTFFVLSAFVAKSWKAKVHQTTVVEREAG